MADIVFNEFIVGLAQGQVNLTAPNTQARIMCALLRDVNNDNFASMDRKMSASQILASEIAAGGGYSLGGKALENISLTNKDSNDAGILDANDVVWANSTITAAGAFLYYEVVATSARIPLAFYSFNGNKSSQNGDFTVQFDSAGILNINQGI